MDVDENSLDSTAMIEQHQLLKSTAQSPSQVSSTFKPQLTNGNSGMEVEDEEDEVLLEQKEEVESKEEEEHRTQPLDLQCESEHLNGVDDNLPSAELSPSLRRSTRASALKAQEKIRLKDSSASNNTSNMVDSHVAENDSVPATPANELISAQTTAADTDHQLEIPVKKQKLSTTGNLDQFDCKFGIRLDNDGDVVMMTDGSEISSLNEEEATDLRQKYKEIMNREDLMLEKTNEQEFQIREHESALRLEEAKLAMMKKLRANQQLSARNTLQENARRLAANMTQNASGNAYKPSIAQQQSAVKLNGNANLANAKKTNKTTRPSISPAGNFQLTPAHQQLLTKLIEQGQLRPEQLATILHSLNPATLAALSQGTKNQQQREQQEREQKLREQQLEKERKIRLEQEAQRKATAEAAEVARQARENAQNTQQKIAAARTQLRRHLEQQLLQLPPPKPPASDLSFIPNATQPDFLYLLGLDLVVQRNLKDKTVFKKVEFDPYVCEECGTDFTPNWKAISGDKEDLHLYCEQCVRQAQKRRVRNERTVLYKKAFQKIAEQEKEFERQVNSGKFNDTSSSSTSAKDASTSSHNTSASKSSNFNAATLSGLSALANNKAFGHTVTSLASNSNNSGNRNMQNNFNAARNQLKQEPPKKNSPQVQQASRKRTAPTTSSGSSNTSNNMSAFAALASNPNALSMLQQMSNMPAALRNMNPMFASLMSNPQLMATFYAQMLQQQQQQQRTSTSSSSSSNNNSSNPASSILQAIAQSHGARNPSNHSSGHQSSNHQQRSSNSSASNILSQMTPAILQQLVAAAQAQKK